MTTEKKLKSSIYSDVRGICKDTAQKYEMEFDQNAMDTIGELTWKKLLLYTQDLEAFHKHAKRSAVTIDDVKLLCRRNTSLKEFMEKEYPSNSSKDGSGATKRKRKTSNVVTLD
ncbi:centromere protein S-like [Onthophagus taurus]|uniref:centromere protein S-like n=1 Tax=Onthophagus taurus TaxID=166361 RepID=UPI000C202746|nr:centromere protein S-like [Onthophagus taurus]